MGCCCDVGGDDPSPRGPLDKLIFIQSLASRWSHPDWFPDRLPVELFHCGPAFNLQGNNIVPAKFIVMRHDLQLEVYLNMSVIGVQMVEMVVTSRWSNLRKGEKKNRSGQGALVLQREHRSRLPGIKKDHQQICFFMRSPLEDTDRQRREFIIVILSSDYLIIRLSVSDIYESAVNKVENCNFR